MSLRRKAIEAHKEKQAIKEAEEKEQARKNQNTRTERLERAVKKSFGEDVAFSIVYDEVDCIAYAHLDDFPGMRFWADLFFLYVERIVVVPPGPAYESYLSNSKNGHLLPKSFRSMSGLGKILLTWEKEGPLEIYPWPQGQPPWNIELDIKAQESEDVRAESDMYTEATVADLNRYHRAGRGFYVAESGYDPQAECMVYLIEFYE